MQPHSVANRGRKRRFAGDCAANSGLVDRIHVSGVPGGRHITRRGGPPQSAAAEYHIKHRRVPPTSRAQNQPSRYTENKVLFSVPCVYARKLFLGGLVRLFEVYERYLCLGAVLSIQRVFNGRPGGSQMGRHGLTIMTGSPHIEFKSPSFKVH